MSDAEPHSYSIAIRIQRTTVEFAFVRVPVTDAVMLTDKTGAAARGEKGQARLDGEKVFQQATEMGKLACVEWCRESEHIEPHPIQKPLEPNERYST